jgi:hypothetical protein
MLTPEERQKVSRIISRLNDEVNNAIAKSENIPRSLKSMKRMGFNSNLNIYIDLTFTREGKKLRKNFRLKLSAVDKAILKELKIARR